MRALKMAKQVRVSAGKPNYLSSSPWTNTGKEKTDSYKLSFDDHIPVPWHMHTHTHIKTHDK